MPFAPCHPSSFHPDRSALKASNATFTPMLCLANSYKHHARCVAGLDWQGNAAGGWIRPVSGAGEDSSIPQPRYGDGLPVLPGHVVGVPLLNEFPWQHQCENRLVRPTLPWRKLGRLAWKDLADLADDADLPLWASGGSVHNDRVLPGAVSSAEGSLRFIRVDRAYLFATRQPGGHDKVKVKIEFGFAGNWYRLSVTDPIVLGAFGRGGLVRADVGETLICASLTLPFGDYCYKLAASVMVRPKGSLSPS